MNIRKYLIMGSQNCHEKPEVLLEEAAKAGITAFQFREKGSSALSGTMKIALGHRLRSICARYDIPFFVNDDVGLVQPLEADGIHIGQGDTKLEKVRGMFPDKYIGISIANQQELNHTPVHLADYVGAGPIYATTTKEDAQSAIGTSWIRVLKQQYPNLPVVGIGGITVENASSVIDAGADGVAVITTITEAKDIASAVRKL